MAPGSSPDGARIPFSSTRADVLDDLWVMDADGSDVVRITETPFVDAWYPRFSADGEWLLFTASSFASSPSAPTARSGGG
jgi:Tol biopolymer transport system component